jgi:hypothetical protein
MEKKWNKGLVVKSDSSSRILKQVNLRDLGVSSPMFMLKPSNLLREQSFLINPKPYIDRALQISALKKDERAKIILDQELNCAICHKPLLDFNNLAKLSTLNEMLTPSSGQFEEDTGSTEVSNSLLVKHLGDTWHNGIQIDHMIPNILFKNIEGYKITDSAKAKVALHVICHKVKTYTDYQLIIKQ